jgi:hypothetical protein
MITIICEHELSIPTDELEQDDELLFGLVRWDELEFYCFSNGVEYEEAFLDVTEPEKFTISEDGLLYKHIIKEKHSEEDGELKVEYIEDGIEREEFTGEVVFGTLFQGKKHDYWIEFQALLWKGEAKEIDLTRYEKNSNAPRLEAKERIMQAVKEMSEPKQKNNLLIRCFGWSVYIFVFPFYFIFSRMYIYLAKVEARVRDLKR